MGHSAESFLRLAQLGFGKLMRGDVIALDHDADGFPPHVVERLKHEIDDDPFSRTSGAALHPCLGPLLAHGFAGAIDLVQHFEKALPCDFGQSLARGFANKVPADQPFVNRRR